MSDDHESGGPPSAPGGNNRRVVIIAAVCAVVGVILVTLLATSPDTADRPAASPLVGGLAPDVEALDTSGEPFDIDDFRGSWVLLNFFATWCAPCVVEHPELVKFSERHAGGDAFVISVAFNEEPEDVEAFFDKHGGDWPVIAEGNGRFALEYGVIRLPESFLISPTGTVAAKFEGGITADEVDGVIAELAARR